MSEDSGIQVKDAQKLDDSPEGLQQRWILELGAADREVEDFHNEGDAVEDEYLGKGASQQRRLNLFHANVENKAANLSGVPKVKARRRFADAHDDVARVSATALERLLNTDIERDSDGFRKALGNAKLDWLRPGLGQVRFRYVFKSEPILDDAGQPLAGEDGRPAERKVFEDVETDHVKWRRFRWSPSETWEDVRWVAYELELSRAEWDRQFPGVPFHPKGKPDGKDKETGVRKVFGRAEVWEIWDKENRRVLFLNKQQRQILRVENDPLRLPGFFPSPQPLMRNTTTSKCVPRSDFYIAKDLYDEANELEKRIRNLVRFVRVSFAYDRAHEGLARLLEDAYDGKGVPVKNWATLVEKGGLQGSVAFLPVKETIEAILALSERLVFVKQEIFEITGQSDLMRGQQTIKETATTSRIKARFGSSRIQAEQDEFARFAGEAQRIRAWIISTQFDAKTIVERSNIERTETVDVPAPPAASGMPSGPPQTAPNQPLIEKAVELLKSDIASYRVDVDAESLSLSDFDSIQQERFGAVEALGGLLQASVPLLANPKGLEFVLEVGDWLFAGTRGADQLQAMFARLRDDIKAAAQQPQAPAPPDPKVEGEKIKLEGTKIKAQAEAQKTAMDMQHAQAEHQIRMTELAAGVRANRADAETDVLRANAMPQSMEGEIA